MQCPRRRPKPDRRRALELLASCRDGCTEAIIIAHGFSVEQMVELVRAGLASATAKRVVAGNKTRRSRACGSRMRGGRRSQRSCRRLIAGAHRIRLAEGELNGTRPICRVHRRD
jgi:hypothetical protein